MLESGYYPAGAQYDPNAPWNESDAPDPTPVKADAIVCISKTIHSCIENTEDYNSREVYDDADDTYEGTVQEVERYANILKGIYPNDSNVDYLLRAVSELKKWTVEDVEINNIEEE